jgi:hypothetical protein
MDSTEVPPAGQRQITSTNTKRHCPNQSEHHATLSNVILTCPYQCSKEECWSKVLRSECPSWVNNNWVHHCAALDTQCAIVWPSTHNASLYGPRHTVHHCVAHELRHRWAASFLQCKHYPREASTQPLLHKNTKIIFI